MFLNIKSRIYDDLLLSKIIKYSKSKKLIRLIMNYIKIQKQNIKNNKKNKTNNI